MKLETRVGLFILAAISIFLYLSISIRAFRFDRDQYNMYKAYFDDTGGLAVKAPVKIAGVEVGWVDEIKLLDDGKAEVLMQVCRWNKLAKNAYAMIHQDGLIGNKVMVIDPGDPSTGFLMPGGTLSMPGRTPTSVGELLDQFRDIATSINEIATSVKGVFASRQGEQNMRVALDSIAKASDRMADFSQMLQGTMKLNEDNINNVLADLRVTMKDLKENVPVVSTRVGDASKRLGSAFEQVEDASIQAKDTFKEAGQVMEKINTGKGLVGKLINEDETYADLKKTVRGLKEYIGRTQSLGLCLDMHGETLLRDDYNNKGYFELKLRPNSDCFYMLQLVADQYGTVSRENTEFTYKDDKGDVLKPSELDIPLKDRLWFANVDKTVRVKNSIKFGLQFGKRFNRLALRVGLFESSFGVGCDYYVPLVTDKIHWISTLEVFDFRGVTRTRGSRPHVKWLNRLYFLRNLYTAFGVDDMYSKRFANPFIGGGLRFGDDDLKYYLSFLPIGKASGQ